MFTSQGLSLFAQEYANWDGLKTVCLTFDTDFAPDYMIEHVLSLLQQYDVRATFFTTHRSQALINLLDDERYELATHPNLSPNTTQGHGLADIISRLKSFYPNITGNRFHVLGYSYRDLVTLGQSGFSYDVSTLRFNCPYLLPAWHPDLRMLLLTYMWEDGICENANLPVALESIDLKSPGLKIINFHPMNVYINGPTSEARLAFLRENPDLLNCSTDASARHRCTGEQGAEQALRGLLRYLSDTSCRTLRVRDVARAYNDLVRPESSGEGNQ
jgi:peptidoglycan/xylan/chitin deacetylase (PgdA/CDA1 family)